MQFQRNVGVDVGIGLIRRVRSVRGGEKIRASGMVVRIQRRCVRRPRGDGEASCQVAKAPFLSRDDLRRADSIN